MTTFRTALIDGFRSAPRLLLLPWYACLLLIGLLQTWPLWTAGGRALRNPMLADLAGGGLDGSIDLFLANPSALASAGAWAGVMLPFTLLSGVVYTFFAGGVLSVAGGKHTFWAGCRRYWWSFLGLGGLVAVLFTLIVALAALAALAVGGLAALIVALLALALLNLVAEYARAIGVAHGKRNPFVLLGHAGMFCVRHFAGVLGLALIATLLFALLVGIYTLAARLLGASPLVLVVQQGFIFGTLWIKGLRLALAARYICKFS